MSTLFAYFKRLNTLFASGIHFIYETCIKPRSNDEDEHRHEFILNVILAGSIILISALTIFIIISMIREGSSYNGIALWKFSILLLFYVLLLFLSRKGKVSFAAYIVLALYYCAATYCIVHWGVELPLAGFGYALTIIAASVLISTRFAFITTGIISLTLLSVGFAQVSGHLSPLLFWKHDLIDMEDPAELSILLFLIMTLSWLSNREMESSLRRAQRSERALMEERDSLEIKVNERTHELKQAQNEKLSHLYRFAEFGRLSSGIFHDLMNSLNAVIANVSQLERTPDELPEVKAHLVKAVNASKRMAEFIATARKQMQTTGESSTFSLNKEVREAIYLLKHKAQEKNIDIAFKGNREILTFGSALKFHQIAVNLIANAIDAYTDTTDDKNGILISLAQDNMTVIFRVTDHGAGIPEDIIEHIFDPFFTTKGVERGIGLGLSTTKSIIEKEFNGTVTVRSSLGSGSSFTIQFPIRYERKHAHRISD